MEKRGVGITCEGWQSQPQAVAPMKKKNSSIHTVHDNADRIKERAKSGSKVFV
jgi:hypothetical protein